MDATAHLIGLGHQRIGFIAGTPEASAAHQRMAGYRAALQAAGIEWTRNSSATGATSPDHPADVRSRAMSGGTRLTDAFVAAAQARLLARIDGTAPDHELIWCDYFLLEALARRQGR